MRHWKVCVVCMVLIVLAGSAWAQYRDNEFSLTIMAGPNIKDLSKTFEDFGQQNNVLLDRPAHANYSIAIEYVPVKWVGIEVVGGVTFGDVDTQNLVGYDLDNWYLTGNLVIHLNPDGQLVPYVYGGAGSVWLVPLRGKAASEFVFNFGAGLDIFTGSPHFSGRLDIRLSTYKFAVSDFAPITAMDLGLPPTFDETQWDLQIMVGIRYKP